MSYTKIIQELKTYSDKTRAKNALWFFKTGPGEYGEGDKFIGVTGPTLRQIAKKYKDVNLSVVQKLLDSPIHEYRQTAVLILVYKYEAITKEKKKTRFIAPQQEIYNLYIKNTSRVNNWDLVDISAPQVVGIYLFDRPKKKKILYTFARSKNLWKKRIAIISTFAFIRRNDFKDALAISKILLNDTHDLIHKAVGWMLREVGNRDLRIEEQFLKKYYKTMPRTMLRYAIEKFDEKKRKWYLDK